MVKSRSSTSSIFRSTFASSSIISDLSGYDTDSVITFRPTPSAPVSPKSKRPPPLHLSNPKSSHRSTASSPTSLPVTPGTPPTSFPFDPFSHPTTLPEPTRSRPASLAHSFERTGKAPEIVVASPSTSTIHYLFPSAPSTTGVHLRTDDKAGLGRHGSRRGRKVHPHPADAFSASTRSAKDGGSGRTTRLASEPFVGIRESKTVDAESMRTLVRQPSLADIGSRGRAGKENVPLTLAGLVEEKRNRSLGLKIHTNIPSGDKPCSPILISGISNPLHLSPRHHANRRRSLSLSSPRAAPVPSDLVNPPSPQLPSPNFGRPLGIEVGDVISSSTYSKAPFSPFAFPGGVPMSRGHTKDGISIDAGKLAARLDAERRLTAARERERDTVRMSVIPEATTPTEGISSDRERRLSLSGRVRRSLSLKVTSETKSLRRRSQSVSARGERAFDTSHPLPQPYAPYGSAPAYELGLGDPSVDMGDRYGLAKIIPSSYSHSTGLGLDVRIDEIGQRSPQRKRIDLGGSEVSLLASSVSMSLGSGRGLGYGSSTSSPLSLPESLMEEAVDLTERGRKVSGLTIASGSGSYASHSTDGGSTGQLSARPTPVLSNTSTPYLASQSQMTTPNPNFPSPVPQTPHFDLRPSTAPHQLGSPALITSPSIPSTSPSPSISGEDNTTRYAVSSRKPNLRYSKSFTSDVGGKVARSFSWRTKFAPAQAAQMKRYVPEGNVEEGSRESRISRSLTFATKARSPVPIEMRQISNPTPILPSSASTAGAPPRPAPAVIGQGPAPVRPARSIKRQPSTGDISQPRWRPPTLYSLCSPDGAVDPLPTPPRKVNGLRTPDMGASAAPITPGMGHLSVGEPYRVFSQSTMTTSPSAKSPSTSPFLSASSSFRGITKSLSKSISRTFHHGNGGATDSVRSADSALKARISSPLEATRELKHQRQEAMASRVSVNALSVHLNEGGRVEKPVHARRESKEWRESILTQVVSASIKDGLCEMARSPTGMEAERTSWSKSVGRTFGLRSSSSTSTGVLSRDSLVGSLPRRLTPWAGEGRALKDIGKQESNMSVYSTASFLPGQPQRQPPPIHISHYSPPKPSAHPVPTLKMPVPIINFSHPRPPIITSPTLDTLSSSPPLGDLTYFPSVPCTSHAIYRPPTPPSSRMALTPTPNGGEGEEGGYAPQPLLSRLSKLPGNQALVQGKEERVKKVLRWRREMGQVEGSEEVGVALSDVEVEEGGDGEGEGEGEEEEEGRLDGLIARHVEGEKERLRGIVRRRSIEGLEAGLGF